MQKFRTYWRKSQEVSEQIKLTVTPFLILNWQKKVKRQGWNFIFQKKKKGLKSSELFAFCLVVVSSFFYICPLQAQSCNRKRQINELFFFSKGKTTLLFVAFRLLVRIVQTKILFRTIERDCFGQRGEWFRSARTMQTLKTFLRADIRLDLTEENVSKVV